MNISYNWLKKYLSLTAPAEEIAELLTQVGLEVSKITPFNPLSTDLIIGETLSCAPHPNAEKLKILKVNIGAEEPVQIICGAPNVDKNQKVVVVPVGGHITTLAGDTHKIKKAKIRGEYSFGMICSAFEIGLGDDHDGIVVLDTNHPAGTPANTHFSMPPDTIFEIDITPNMGNACSHLGVARELAATLGKSLTRPIIEPLIASDNIPIKVDVTDNTLCPRYTGIVIKGLQIGPSPMWLRGRLHAIGLKPINNVVDITNLIMHDLGQPLHAFDYDKIVGKKLSVGIMKKNTPMTPLYGDPVKLDGKEIMIYDEEGPLCMAGIIGDSRAQVTSETTTIFLESAFFDKEAIAKSARNHTLHTDASFRFERGTDIEMPYVALQKATELIEELAHGTIASEPVDYYPKKATSLPVPVTYTYIHNLLGKKIPAPTIHNILDKLDILVKDITEEGFTAHVPPYRIDVTRPADIVEEIIRIHGYDKIPLAPLEETLATLSPVDCKTHDAQEDLLRILTAQGFHEMITNALMSQASLSDTQDIVTIANPLSQALDILRPTMLYTGLASISHNVNRNNHSLKLFEVGKTYHHYEEGYHEEEHLSLFLAGETHPPHWLQPSRPFALNDLYAVVVQLFHYYGAPKLTPVPQEHPHFSTAIALQHEGTTYATLGEVTPEICAQADIKIPVFFTEIPMAQLLPQEEATTYTQNTSYTPLPLTPAITRDLSLALPEKILFQDIQDTLTSLKLPYTLHLSVKDIYTGKELNPDEKSYTLRLTIQGSKTFTEKEIHKLMEKITNALTEKLGATIRS